MTTIRQQCIACALANTPPSVRVVRIRKDLSGSAHTDPRDPEFGLLCAPRPLTRKALQVYLHECSHFVFGAGKRPRYLEEYECEQWAFARMREAGIAVPRSMTKRAKEYVRDKIYQAANRGAKKFDPQALKFAGLKLQRPPNKKEQAAHQAALEAYRRQWENVPVVMVRFVCPSCGAELTMSVRACFIKEVRPGCSHCEVWMKPQPGGHFKGPSGSLYF